MPACRLLVLAASIGIAEAAVGAIDLVSEGGEHIREHHRDERLVFDKQNAFTVGIQTSDWHRNGTSICGLNASLRGSALVVVRYAQGAAQSIRLPVEVHETAELPFDACDDGPAPVAAGESGGVTCGPPDSVQTSSSFPGSVRQVSST